MTAPLLLLKVGSSSPSLKAARGDYDRIFIDAMPFLRDPMVVHDAQAAPPPEGRDWAAVIVTGSASSVHDREPWSEDAAAWLKQEVERGTPVLGVCYGHQLLAHALGGRTERSQLGPEVGRWDVTWDDDPLFAGLARPLPVFQLHWDRVVEPPPGARVFGWSERCPVQAMALGDRVRSVQFHPEFDEPIVAMRFEDHGPRLDRWRPGEWARCEATLGPADDARLVLRNFIERFTDVATR